MRARNVLRITWEEVFYQGLVQSKCLMNVGLNRNTQQVVGDFSMGDGPASPLPIATAALKTQCIFSNTGLIVSLSYSESVAPDCTQDGDLCSKQSSQSITVHSAFISICSLTTEAHFIPDHVCFSRTSVHIQAAEHGSALSGL